MAAEDVMKQFRSRGGADQDPSALLLRVLQALEPGAWPEPRFQKLLDGLPAGAPASLEQLLGCILQGEGFGAVAAATAGGPEVVFVLGGPGSGKGTFSTRAVEQFGYQHLSAGDLIRAERKRPGSAMAELIESRLTEGRLIPSEVTVGLVEEEMRRQGWEGGRYLIDGFPRSLDNYETWDRLLGNKAHIKFVLLIECSQAVMEQRLLKRGQTSGRSDDNIETIRKRFITFKEETVPVQDLLESRGLVRTVNSDPGIDAVWHEVVEIFS
mmetsp:Transcript_12648/g.40745  ORF Transcript_12648/g.40745 Transcript_12648/m.40745 type:complete len:268 (-) Transcript_12648:198-1001(-)